MALALITGGSSGIGLATAELFAKNNIDLILCGRRTHRLDEFKKAHAQLCQIDTLSFDVRDYKEMENALNSLGEKIKKIDILINNAGGANGLTPFHQAEINDMETMIDTNLKGLVYITRLISPFMIANKKGTIINVSSIAGKETYPNGNVYSATKHAVDALTKSMRMDFNPFGIKVASINPGMVETEFSLNRFAGDKARAKSVYSGIDPLTAYDIADAIYYMSTRPAHVVISDLTILPLAQASTQIVNRL